MAGLARIWSIYQEPAYVTGGTPVKVNIAVKNMGTSDTIWVTARFDSTTCIDHFGVGIPPNTVFKWWSCDCGTFTPPAVTVHIEAGHGGGTTPDDIYDYIIHSGTSLACSAGGPYVGEIGVPLSFTGFAQGGMPPYTWNWDFGDGIGTSTEQNPTYTYTREAIFNVKFTVHDVAGRNCFEYQTATIGNGAVRCWRCNGATPEYRDFPLGTVCGQGDATGWPLTEEPTCEIPPPPPQAPFPWILLIAAAGLTIGYIIYKKWRK